MTEAKVESKTVLHEDMTYWANAKDGPVALHLRQKLQPIGEVIFPPTYADIGYNIDTLSDGTKVVTIDSVGSQANRMEPIFKQDPYAALVPQIAIRLGNKKPISILEIGHRLGDAVVRASSLAEEAKRAFAAYEDDDDPSLIARLAPTSLVFGVWDSRGAGAKLPRLVSAVVRGWDVDVLHRAATYLPATDFAADDLLGHHNDEKAEKDARSALGFQHAPAIWTSNEKIPEYRDAKPNIDRRLPGGIVARGGIYRDVTVNLVALRRLGKEVDEILRNYILGIALVAADHWDDGFLRQGCLLTLDPDDHATWFTVERSGKRTSVKFAPQEPFEFAKSAAEQFGVASARSFDFDGIYARRLIDEQKGGKKGEGRKKKRNDQSQAENTENTAD